MRAHNHDLLEIDGVRTTLSLAASINTRPIWVGTAFLASVVLTVTGTPAGSFQLQVSNDLGQINAASEAQQYAGVTNWANYGSPVVISAAGSTAFNMPDAGFYWMRVAFIQTGPGTTPVLSVARAALVGV